MNSLWKYLCIATLLIACNQNQESTTADKKMEDITPPLAKKIPKELTAHGDVRVDDYFWMRLSDEQKNAEKSDEQTQDVLNYLNAENSYKESVMKDTENLQDELFKELKGRIKEQDESVPYKSNGYHYYVKKVRSMLFIAEKKER